MSDLSKLLHARSREDASCRLPPLSSLKQPLFSEIEPRFVSVTAPHEPRSPGGSYITLQELLGECDALKVCAARNCLWRWARVPSPPHAIKDSLSYRRSGGHDVIQTPEQEPRENRAFL